MIKLTEGMRVRIKQLDYLKPCLQGKEGAIDEVVHTRPRNLYHVQLDKPDPVSGAVVEASELEVIKTK